MHALWWMLAALAVLTIGYRYYSAFLAAKVLALDDLAQTPAHRFEDGENFHPTHKFVLFGHHFAAISGAGPLIGPVLAVQFGFLPGYLWILFGVVLGGAVQDFVILVGSVRRGGRSLAEIAREELGPGLGAITAVAILFIVVVALAGLGRVVVEALAESAWGVFTIGASMPIALGMGLYIQKLRGGAISAVRQATIAGVVLLFAALIFGKTIQDGQFAHYFRLSKTTLTVAIAAYGFIASVLPVWMLLCPRDYLSSYLKIGTIGLLVLGIVVVNPRLEMPAFTTVGPTSITIGETTFGRVVPGSLFPFVFITIACGAISGFHALVSSGTTPKMIDKESDCRTIGYGAMLMEALVGITALLAASSLPPPDYFAINTDPKVPIVAAGSVKGAGAAQIGKGLARSVAELSKLDEAGALTPHDRDTLGLAAGASATTLAGRSLKASAILHLSNGALASLGYGVDRASPHAAALSEADFLRLGIPVTDLPGLSQSANEVVAARTGGAVSLAIGMARVFSRLPGMSTLLAYWYHFAIMFEALFVLTTIDTGTRIARFLVQEMAGRVHPKLGDPSFLPASIVATGLVVLGWSYFILTGSIATIWPMFGVANQLLASAALCIGTTLILRRPVPRRYALVTLLPLTFVSITTITAGIQALRLLYLPMSRVPETALTGKVNVVVISVLLVAIVGLIAACVRQWSTMLTVPEAAPSEAG
jgi:carbon starvation protein